MKKSVIVILLLLCSHMVSAQISKQEINLYDGVISNAIDTPNEERIYNNGVVVIEKVSHPTLTVYLPHANKATGATVLICPGGGYAIVAIKHEGHDVARRFAEKGIAAIVLKYRLPNKATSINPSIVPLQDAQQALLVVRRNAEKWNINPDRVGIMGFSAGGHLASTVGTHFTKNYVAESGNVRPDFMLLIYPVISFNKEITHNGSVVNLLGENPTDEQRDVFSNEKNVTPQTPPTFLVHAADDNAVPIQNSIRFVDALKKNGVVSKIHMYTKGGHGFGLNNPTSEISWFDLCIDWMQSQGLMTEL